jgi:tetratricopeptide (TPR) repeat protein
VPDVARVLAAVAAVALCAAIGSGCTTKKQTSVEDVRAMIQGQIDKNLSAGAAGDSAAFWSIFTDDYSYRGYDGRIVHREEAARGFRENHATQLPMSPETRIVIDSIQVHGDTATVYTTQHVVRKGTGSDSTEHMVVTNVTHRERWLRTPEGWKNQYVEELTVGPTLVDNTQVEIDLAGLRFVRAYWDGGLDSLRLRYIELRSSRSGTSMPFSENALNNLGRTLLLAGEPMDAIHVLSMNVDAFPNSAKAYGSLAEGYAVMGRRDEAIGACRRALRLDPTNPTALEVLKKLGAS